MKTIKLTEAESQYLCDLLLREIELLAKHLGGRDKAIAYLKSIDKNHAEVIYKKII